MKMVVFWDVAPYGLVEMTDILDEFIASIVDYSETLVNIFQTTP
jgi:hypothetical protein